MMSFRWAIGIAVLLAAGASIVGAPAMAAPDATVGGLPASQETITGVSVGVKADEKQSLMDQMSDYVDDYGVEPRDTVWVVMNDRRTWVVYTDRSLTVGMATVTGFTIGPSAEGTGVVFADQVSIDTDAESVSATDLASNPGQYTYRMVGVEGEYRQVGYTADFGEGSVQRQMTFGTIAAEPLTGASPIASPGRSGRWAVLNLSGNDYGGSRTGELSSRLVADSPSVTTVRYGTRSFWVNGSATVRGVVLNRPPGAPPGESGEPVVYISDVQPDARSVDGTQAVTTNGDRYAGEVVKFEQ